MNLAHRTVLVLGSALGLLVACTTNVTNNNGGSGSTPVPTADCNSRCQAKATGCQATTDQATTACSQVCDGTYTNDQLSCLEAKTCAQLQNVSFASLCPASSTGTSGGTSGTSGSSGTSTTKFSCNLNGTCYKCSDSAGVQKCSITTGPGPGCTETVASYCN